MKPILTAAAAAGLMVLSDMGDAALADPGDHWMKQWEKWVDCEKKLYEAKSSREFHKKAAECNRELAKLDHEQRKEAAKAWGETEKKWRERWRGDDSPYYDWDDD